MNFKEFFPFKPAGSGKKETEESKGDNLEEYALLGREALSEEIRVEEKKHGAKDPHLLEIDLKGLTPEDFRIYGKFKMGELDQKEFEDGDVLFVAHRMKLKGEIGPTFQLFGTSITASISKMGFHAWKDGYPIRNALIYTTSFMYERLMLIINDLVVAVTGRNYFFPNKPQQFHDECTTYCRAAVFVRGLLWKMVGWKSILFLYLSETLWSIPPHPACAMFVTNHGSTVNETTHPTTCIPSSSTYAGRWYSILTLGTNYHCEHHDFPTIPLHRLGELRKIAPEFYRTGSKDGVFRIMKRAFSKPEFYACMDATITL